MPLIVITNSTSSYVHKFRVPIIRALQAQGFRVAVLAPRDECSAKLEALGCDFYHIDLDGKSVNPLKELLLVGRFYKAYRNLRPSVVLHYTPKPNIYGSLAARMLNIPVINNISGLGSGFIRGRALQKIVIALYKMSQRRAGQVFFQNKDDMALFLEKRIVNAEQSGLLPGSGVDVDEFAHAEWPDQEVKTFLFVGRLLRDKGVAEYLDAAKMLLAQGVKARFHLLGGVDNGNPSSLTKTDVARWSELEGVTFLGEQADVQPYLRSAHCVVLPSYREGTPRSLLEAASLGRIIIAADAVGTREPVDDGVNGFLCKVGDSEDLARVMLKVCELNTEQQKAMGEASRALAEQRYDVKHVVNSYSQVVSKLIMRDVS